MMSTIKYWFSSARENHWSLSERGLGMLRYEKQVLVRVRMG